MRLDVLFDSGATPDYDTLRRHFCVAVNVTLDAGPTEGADEELMRTISLDTRGQRKALRASVREIVTERLHLSGAA